MRFRYMITLAFLTGAFGACAADDTDTDPQGGQTGSEGVTASCEVTNTTVLGLDDVSVLGFSGADMVSLAGGENTLEMKYSRGGSAQLTLDFAYTTGAIRYVETTFVSNGTGPEIALGCLNRMEVEGALGFSTDDGAFNESWSVVLTAEMAGEVRYSAELDPDNLGGTYTVTEVNPADFDDVRLFVDIVFSEAQITGRLSGQASTTGDVSDPNATATAEMFEVATWPASAEE